MRGALVFSIPTLPETNNLAQVLQDIGRLAAAETLMRRDGDLRKKPGA